ncbi:MAG: recombinase family protein [Eubacteriales bacterium]|jgi:DNA invertase Pin-like site-specific DNA recombinase|uniref:recombinase family protein n=1 Tax=Syntrophomonas wolfei TaxID=863 RepID=UPI0023F23039|nr:recombinase family protein [Syntrophomonas wolfei]MDD2217483.1 recombinase family protein [Eubacteriales bacterium]MDD4390889.1 recombinase family protein [Eubacteriales bacterium]
MADNKTIHYIPPLPPKREKRVGIYCRVSTNSADQLKSLTAQVSALTRLTAVNPKWLLVDVYIDIASSKTGSSRKEFTRMLKDCQSHDLEIILTKSISRFGRDTVGILDALNQLKLLGVRVIFEQEVLDTADTDSDLMISIIESIAQAENESRSDNIKWGIKQRAAQGTSKLYNRKCYGYVNASDGSLMIKDEESKNVRLIFNLYLRGKSVIGIISELEKLGIKSPTGKGKWCKRTIDVMLSNEKYIGNVRLLDDGKHDLYYLSEENNPAIISKETFQAVQIEKQHRSNVTKAEDSSQRKSKKYSSKK